MPLLLSRKGQSVFAWSTGKTLLARGDRLERGVGQQAPASEGEDDAERDHLALADELTEEERLRAEREREEDEAVQCVSDGGAQSDAERQALLPERREDDRLDGLADREGDDAG